LQDLVAFKELLPEASATQEIDVYSLFIRKLLEQKVTQSIEQLIRSDLIPIVEL
jgi:hypothetical protein